MTDDKTMENAEPGPSEEEAKTAQDLMAELETIRQERDDFLDRYQRQAAEFQNYRKRQDRERGQQIIRITADVVRRILPITDDLQRALAAVPEQETSRPWVEGVSLIQRKFDAMLTDLQITEIDALGKPFDPTVHSALLQEPSDEYPEATVMEVMEKGYKLGDHVVRPSLVKVSTGPAN